MPKAAYNRRDYHAALAYHICLLFASFALLPRSRSGNVHQSTSSDRPEHPWLTPITHSPTRTLLYHIMGEWVCVVLWGQHLATWLGVPRPTDKQQRVNQNLKRLKGAVITTGFSIPAIAAIFWTFGAPPNLKTLLLAVHAALLLVWAPVQAIGWDRFKLTRLFASFSPESDVEKAVVYPVIGALFGGWFGGILLALDWDRPWQGYPLTPAFGMLIGYAAGHIMH